MKTLCLVLYLILSLASLTLRGEEPAAPRAMPHIYVATRVVPRVLRDGSLVIDIKDESGAQAVVGIPTDIINQLIALSGRKTAI